MSLDNELEQESVFVYTVPQNRYEIYKALTTCRRLKRKHCFTFFCVYIFISSLPLTLFVLIICSFRYYYCNMHVHCIHGYAYKTANLILKSNHKENFKNKKNLSNNFT